MPWLSCILLCLFPVVSQANFRPWFGTSVRGEANGVDVPDRKQNVWTFERLLASRSRSPNRRNSQQFELPFLYSRETQISLGRPRRRGADRFWKIKNYYWTGKVCLVHEIIIFSCRTVFKKVCLVSVPWCSRNTCLVYSCICALDLGFSCYFQDLGMRHVKISRVESSLYAKKWRAPLGTGVKKKWNVNKLQNIYTKFSLNSNPAEVDEVVRMRLPPVLVFSSIHPMSHSFVTTIGNQFVFPSVCRASCIARPRRSPS